MEKRCLSSHRNLHMNWQAKPEVGAKIPVAVQPLVKVVFPIQHLWSCSSSDTGTLDTCRNCLPYTCFSQGVNMHVHGLDSCWECLFLTVSSSPKQESAISPLSHRALFGTVSSTLSAGRWNVPICSSGGRHRSCEPGANKFLNKSSCASTWSVSEHNLSKDPQP